MDCFDELLLAPNIKKFLTYHKEKQSQTVFGLTEGEIGVLLSLSSGKTILIASNEQSITFLEKQLSALGKECFFLPIVQEQPLYSFTNNGENAATAIKSLYEFNSSENGVLLTTATAALQTFPSMESIVSSKILFEVGKTQKLSVLAKNLVSIGFERTEKVSACGEFSLRGDILDIWLDGSENVLRIDFFGDEVESIKEIDYQAQTSLKKLASTLILPRTTFLISETESELLIERMEAAFMVYQRKNFNLTFLSASLEEIKQSIKEGKRTQNLAFASVFTSFSPLVNLFESANIVVCEPKMVLEKANGFYKEFLQSANDFSASGTLMPEHKKFFVSPLKAFSFSTQVSKIAFKSIYTSQDMWTSEQIVYFQVSGRQKYVSNREILISDVKNFVSAGKKVFVFAGSRGNAGFLQSDFDFAGLKENVCVSDKKLPLSALFSSEQLVLIGTDDLFGGADNAVTNKSSKNSAFFLPKVGDFVVHATHGIGKCIALERLKFSDFEKDYIVLEYADGDKLYVPSEQANMVSAFHGGDRNPKLNHLGGTEFFKSKQKVRASVKAMAFDLLKLYSEREKRKGIAYPKDSIMEKELGESFEFDETPDQQLAINNVLADMESDKIMDRLICGDVGYGKTEVAIRAIFKAVSFGKQVAFLCPTTILAEQHFMTCQTRFAPFGVRVKVLSRFRSKAEQKQILIDLKDHKVDVLVGTHRLLSKDVKFDDLGLLVLDEEQRFGVGHKEQIKETKKNVDTIAMSATPIPRTLHMALTGIRDISIIETPPRARLPIVTTVTEYDDSILAYACEKELSRGGQVLVVVNRIAQIEALASKVRALVPEARVAIAHGQMASTDLEDVMMKLTRKELDILVATTLIENGIDLPKANTLFVIDAGNLGLSQLYQLRGRVGRSDRQAYAYLTFNGRKDLSDESHKRLAAIGEFTELGSGFKIAMRDLEIRGAGDVLGSMQHGHMQKIGYDMYCKILEEVTNELKGEKAEELKDIVMEVNTDAYLPQNYVSGGEERIAIFSKISVCTTAEDEKHLLKGLVEMFGEVPKSLRSLVSIARLKNNAQKIGVKKVRISADNCEIVFHSGENKFADGILTAVQKFGSTCVLKGGENIVVSFKQLNASIIQKLDFVLKFCLACLAS